MMRVFAAVAAGLFCGGQLFAQQDTPGSRQPAADRFAVDSDAGDDPAMAAIGAEPASSDDQPPGPLEGIPSDAASYGRDDVRDTPVNKTIRVTRSNSARARSSGYLDRGPANGFGGRFLQAYADDFRASHVLNTFGQSTGPSPPRRQPPAPFSSPPFPSAEFFHMPPLIGVPYSNATYPLERALKGGPYGNRLENSRIHVYGYADVGGNLSTSRQSNIPMAYDVVPNAVELDQLILRFERVPDSVQMGERDWGFRFTNLYGIDYRYTTAKGWFSEQLLNHNNLYGYDPLELYGTVYLPNVGEGTIVKVGRYTSPPDIEAQLAIDNYLYSHSLMFTYDPYTFTGIHTQTKLDDRWTVYLGVHAGNDMAPWTSSAQPNGQALARWVSKSNNDSLLFGVNSIGRGKYTNGHDNKQMVSYTWTHKFNDTWHTASEAYYIWQFDALKGGTVVNGPPRSFFPGVGPGPLIPGISDWVGFVNYTQRKFSSKDYATFRSDFMDDFKGQQTGFATAYTSFTLGWCHHASQNMFFRPEFRWDHSYSAAAYDNGTKQNQWVFACDIVHRF